jgi:hypothetical protein
MPPSSPPPPPPPLPFVCGGLLLGLAIDTKPQKKRMRKKSISENGNDSSSACHACNLNLSSALNRLLTCSTCGMSVHKACYGLNNISSSSTTTGGGGGGGGVASGESAKIRPWRCHNCEKGVGSAICPFLQSTTSRTVFVSSILSILSFFLFFLSFFPGLEDAQCMLCPHKGGAFKHTTDGRFVHIGI